MKAPFRLFSVALALLVVLAASPSQGQYLYLDSNGDGVNSVADVLAPVGPTTVDVWIQTNANRDGTPVTCLQPGYGLTLGSYSFILHVIGGTVDYTGFEDHLGFELVTASGTGGPDFFAGRAGSNPFLPAGLYKVATLRVAVLSGSPTVYVVGSTPVSPYAYTGFGSACAGADYDNLLKLGVDWYDTNGIGPGSTTQYSPTFDAPSAMIVDEGTVAVQTLHATDPDGATAPSLQFRLLSGPSFATVATTSASPTEATGTLTLAPTYAAPRTATATIGVTDGVFNVARAVDVTVNDVPVPLVFPPIADVTVTQHVTAIVSLGASDPNGLPLSYRLDDAPGYVSLLSGNLAFQAHLDTDVGTRSLTVTAYTTALSVTQTFQVTVLPNPQPPALSLVGSNLNRGVEGSVVVSAIDPEMQPIASLTFDASSLPAGDTATFTTTPDRSRGTLIWTPSAAGFVTLRFTAIDASGLATTRGLPVGISAPAPIVSAPPVVDATPLAALSFDVSTVSPDGVGVPSLTIDPNAAMGLGATFLVNPQTGIGTFSWTPPAFGVPVEDCQCYSITFRATNGLAQEEADTQIRLSLSDVDTIQTAAYRLLVTNAGEIGLDPHTRGPGMVYSAAPENPVLRGLGPWIAGKVDNDLRVSRGGADTEFTPGVLGPTGPVDYAARFRNWRLTRNDESDPDFLNWPIQDGAPVTSAGAPRLQGRSLLWSVSQDLSGGPRGTTGEYSIPAMPLPVELRQTVFAFDAGPLQRIAFLRFAFTNRGTATIESTYVGVFADPNVGRPQDDFAGYDRTTETGFVYNSSPYDNVFGVAPPAIGVTWLRGPESNGVRLPCTAFQTYTDQERSDFPVTGLRSFLFMQGKDNVGGTLHVGDEKDAPFTTFRFDGDPITGAGWLDDWALDKRIVLSAGPFTLAPGATAEYEAALIIGQGGNRAASIEDLRSLAGAARALAADDYVPSPFVSTPAAVDLDDGVPFLLRITALDPDGDPLTSLTADLSELPAASGASFEASPGQGVGTLRWTPHLGHASSFTVRFTATSDRSATYATTLRVRGPNHAPVANAGGPYTGVRGVAVAMTSSASTDADGDHLFTTWDFGDGGIAVGAATHHAYAATGTFIVTATISDGFDQSDDKTLAAIGNNGVARAWVSSGGDAIRLASPRDEWCFQLEPIERSFSLDAINGPISLIRLGTGGRHIQEIPPLGGAPADLDGDGDAERRACFAAADVRSLFDDLPEGEWTEDLRLAGVLTTGAAFEAPVTVRVLVPGALAASVAPNPVNPGGLLTVRTTRSGRVRVTVHDVRGRAVRTLQDGTLQAGLHDFRIDGRDASGARLASGLYFYRIEAPEGMRTGRFTVLK